MKLNEIIIFFYIKNVKIETLIFKIKKNEQITT